MVTRAELLAQRERELRDLIGYYCTMWDGILAPYRRELIEIELAQAALLEADKESRRGRADPDPT